MSDKIERASSAPNIGNRSDTIIPRLDDLVEFCGLQQSEESGKRVVYPSKFEDRQPYYQELSKLFRSFLKKCLCLESLLFLVDAQNFKSRSLSSSAKPADKVDHAQQVYKKYLKQSATHQINVDETLRVSVKEKLKDSVSKGAVDPDVFDSIEKAIFVLLEEDSFQKFLKSDTFKQFSQKQQSSSNNTSSGKEKSKSSRSVKASDSSSSPVGHVTTQAEVGLQQCRRHSQGVLDLFKERDDIMEVMEYITTVQHVADIADLAIKNRVTTVPEATVKSLQMILRDYKMFLEHYKTTGRFGRLLTSARLKSLLDQYNYQVWTHLDVIQECVKKSEHSTPTHASTLRKITQFFNHPTTDTEVNVFTDDAVKSFWDRYVGAQKMWGEWKSLIAGLEEHLGEKITEEEEKVLKYLLDSSSTGSVSQYKLAEFLKGFGPLRTDTTNCVKMAKSIVNHDGFYGFLSKFESEFFLTNKAVGSYLIRFLKARSSSFAISYVDEKHRTVQIIIEGGKSGFKVTDRSGKDKHYESVLEVIEANKENLFAPVTLTIPLAPWFWGDITSLESSELLAGLPNGTFLVRLSSSLENDLVASVIENGELKHWSISKRSSNGKYTITNGRNSGEEFDSVEDLIKHQDTLKTPLTRSEALSKRS